MKRSTILKVLLIMVCMATGSESAAATTTLEGNIAYGQSDTMAYEVQVRQGYEPWLSGSVGELSPTAELGGFAWVGDDGTVWGMSFAPGLMFSLYTSAGFQPFLAASIGGALLSDTELERRHLGTNLQFRTRGSVGVMFGDSLEHRIQGNYTHYSNAGLDSDNDGYNTYGVTYGYSF